MTAYLKCEYCGFEGLTFTDISDNGMLVTCKRCKAIKELSRADMQDTLRERCTTSKCGFNGRGRQNWF